MRRLAGALLAAVALLLAGCTGSSAQGRPGRSGGSPEAMPARFPSAFDGQGRLMTDQGLNALPVTSFLTADGTVAYRQVGPVTSPAQLEQLVWAHLGLQL